MSWRQIVDGPERRSRQRLLRAIPSWWWVANVTGADPSSSPELSRLILGKERPYLGAQRHSS